MDPHLLGSFGNGHSQVIECEAHPAQGSWSFPTTIMLVAHWGEEQSRGGGDQPEVCGAE